MTTKIERRNFELTGLEVRAKSDETSGKAAGYAAVFNSDSLDLGGFVERIAPGAFARSLADADSNKLNIFALWAHDMSQPLGSTGGKRLVLSEDERGLSFELETSRMNVAQLGALEDNDLRMSFGFAVREQNWEEMEDGSIIRTLLDVDLMEVSFVINPAYPDTEAALRSLDTWKQQQVKIERHNPAMLIRRALEAQLRSRLRP